MSRLQMWLQRSQFSRNEISSSRSRITVALSVWPLLKWTDERNHRDCRPTSRSDTRRSQPLAWGVVGWISGDAKILVYKTTESGILYKNYGDSCWSFTALPTVQITTLSQCTATMKRLHCVRRLLLVCRTEQPWSLNIRTQPTDLMFVMLYIVHKYSKEMKKWPNVADKWINYIMKSIRYPIVQN